MKSINFLAAENTLKSEQAALLCEGKTEDPCNTVGTFGCYPFSLDYLYPEVVYLRVIVLYLYLSEPSTYVPLNRLLTKMETVLREFKRVTRSFCEMQIFPSIS